MSQVPDELRYTKEHEWARMDEDGRITVGITDFAQEQLGDIVYLDLPDSGDEVTGGEPMGEVESTKSVSDLYSPLTGSIIELNSTARDNPGTVNQDPYGEGWLIVIEAADVGEYDGLLTAEEYSKFLSKEAGEDD